MTENYRIFFRFSFLFTAERGADQAGVDRLQAEVEDTAQKAEGTRRILNVKHILFVSPLIFYFSVILTIISTPSLVINGE